MPLGIFIALPGFCLAANVVLLTQTLFAGRKTPYRAVCLLPLGKSFPAYLAQLAEANDLVSENRGLRRASARKSDRAAKRVNDSDPRWV